MCKKREMYFIICDNFFYSIYFLQDTHLDPKLDKYITAEWGFTSYFCSNNNLEVRPYFSIMILKSRSKGYLGTMEEIS